MRRRHNVICSQSGFTIFFHILINGTIYGKKETLLNTKCVWFSLQRLSETFLIRTERDMTKNEQGTSCIVTRYSCPILMKLKFARQIFEHYFNIKFRKNLSSVSRVISRGQTDRHDEANSRFSQFCESA